MPKYGQTSNSRLDSVRSKGIKAVFRQVVRYFDNTIPKYGGTRTIDEQVMLFNRGSSKTLESRHLDGMAVDAIPYPVRWPRELQPDENGMVHVETAKAYAKDLGRFYYFGGYVLGTADCMGVHLDWGGDWDSDRDVHDQSFDDLLHFQEKKR